MHTLTLRAKAATGVVAVAALAGSVGMASAASNAKVASTSFKLFPQTAELNCLKPNPSAPSPTVNVTVNRGSLNDSATVKLAGFKPGLGFDLFTISHSPQQANGTPDPNSSVGLAWYQSDIQVGSNGAGQTTIKTILLDQIFGVDKDVALAPTNTFHLGFWFDNPAAAAACGFTGVTPFNGEHTAGPLGFVTRPNATTKLGPLCTDPKSAGAGTFVCNP